MKKNYFLIAVALVATLFVGCEQADDYLEPNTPPTPPTEEVKMQHFVATLGDPNADSRVAIHPDANNQVWSYEWEDGDMVMGIRMPSLSATLKEIMGTITESDICGFQVSVDDNGVATIEGDAPIGNMALFFMPMERDGEYYDLYLDVDDMLGSYVSQELSMTSDVFEIVDGVSILPEPIKMHHTGSAIDLSVSLSGVDQVEISSIEVCNIQAGDFQGFMDYMYIAEDGTVNFWDQYSKYSADKGSLKIMFNDGRTLLMNDGDKVSVPFSVDPFIFSEGAVIVYNFADGRIATTQITLNNDFEIEHGLHYTFNSVITADSFKSDVKGDGEYLLSDFPDDYQNYFYPTEDVWTIVGTETVVMSSYNASKYKSLLSTVDYAYYLGRSISLNFPQTQYVERVWMQLFDSFSCLTSLSLPNAIIEPGALGGLDALESLVVDDDIYYFDNSEKILYNADKSTIHRYFLSNKSESYTAPESVRKIESYAFENDYGDDVYLKSASFPEVIHVSPYAFDNSKISSITLPKVESIEQFAFNQSAVETIDVSEVQYIGKYAFDGCNELSSVKIPAAKSIGNGVFDGCELLTNIEVNEEYFKFEDGVLYNADKTFLHTYLCSNTATTYTAPESVTVIGESAFGGFADFNLTSISCPNVTTLEYAAIVANMSINLSLPSVTRLGSRSLELNGNSTLEFATKEGVKIEYVGGFLGNSDEKASSTTLKIGSRSAAEYVNGNTFTCKDHISDGKVVTYTFKEIIVVPN